MRLMDCPNCSGVFAPVCAICWTSILPPTLSGPTCPAPCGRVLAHGSPSCTGALCGSRP